MCNNILSAAVAALLAFGSSHLALASKLSDSSASPVASATIPGQSPAIAIDPANRAIGLDVPALSRLALGSPVTVSIAGAGEFQFVIDHFNATTDVIEVSGHLRGDDRRRITIGLHGETATGLISIPGATYAIGYGSNNQALVGLASTQWLVDALGDRLSLKRRKPLKGELLPPAAVPTQIDIAGLHGMKEGDATVMQLPDIGATRMTLDRLLVGASTTWIGHLTDFGPSYTATITYSPAGVDGYIVTPEGAVSLTMSNLDQPYLFNPAKAGLKTVDGDCVAPLPPSAAAQIVAQSPLQANAAVTGRTTASSPVTADASTSTGQVIDVLVYYTPGMLSAYGSIDKLTTRVDQLVALSNQAYAAGKLPHQIRRVGLEMANVADSNSNGTLLSQFVSGQGAFAGVAAKRDQLGADLVAILRPLYAQTQGSCGVAYVTGANQTNVANYSRYGYAVISDGRDQTGQPYYCDDLTFTHELGHNEGLMHDRATTLQQNGGVLPLPTGATAYAYGYAVSGQFGTIMSYASPHVVKFSNPLDSTCNGNQVCGIASSSTNSADNVLALSYTMPIVAGFRPTVVPASSSVYVTGTATVNGAATPGIGFSTNSASVTCTASGSTGMYTCTVPKGTTNLTITPAYVPAGGGSVTWQPASVSLASVTANVTQNFAGTWIPPVNVYVSGTATINGAAAAGVKFATNNAKVACSASNTSGAYSCTVPKGTTGLTITPQYTPPAGNTLTWQPASVTLSAVNANVAQNFAGTMKAQSHNVEIKVMLNNTATTSVPISISYVSPGATRLSCAINANVSYVCKAAAGTKMTITPGQVAGTKTITYTPTTQSITVIQNTSVTFNATR